MSLKRYFLLLVLSCVVGHAHAEDPTPRSFDDSKIESLREELALEYDTSVQNSSSFLERFGEWIISVLESFSKFLSENLNVNIDPFFFKLIFYGFAISAIVYLIIKLAGAERTIRLFWTKKKIGGPPFSIEEESIDHTDFSKLIEEAQQTKNYALVIRYYYLSALQFLSEKGEINFHIRKTNTQYIQELGEKPFSAPFVEMSSLFEFIWYGNYTADSAHCERMSAHLKSLKSGTA